MARRSTTGSKGSKAKARKARVLKASKAAKNKRPIGPASANRSRPSVAELKRQLEHRTREADELRQQQAASADVLKVISRPSFDLQVVFDTLLKSAAQLCQADHSFIYLREGDGYCCVSGSGDIPEWIEFLKQQTILPGRGTVAARAVLEGHTVHIPDVLADPEYTFNEAQKRGGYRTALGVPLLREGTTIGVMVLTRPTVRPFDANQIALVNTFADQAVIAIENARLFDEVQAKTRDLQEALTSQTGSAKILKVIASSPTDVGPVLNAIVESACELCEAHDAVLRLRDGENLCVSAHHGPIPTSRQRWPINPNWTAGRSVLDRKPIHVSDMVSPEGDEFPEGRRPGATRGLRTILSVPLLREGEPIGAITLRRTEVHPFSDKQITLLQTFADQAVIAIGNVRLFEEVQTKTRDLEESLQQQTATSEVLEVINASPGELAPVFDSMLEKAMRLCRAAFGGLWVFEGDRYVAVALRNVPAGYAKYLSRTTAVPGPHTAPYRFHEGERSAIQNIDLAAEEPYRAGDPQRRALVDLGGARTALQVPLLRDEVVLGVITIYRQEVRPFSDKQLELLQNFAAQAVIAIENARLFNETKEALAQQIATSDVLRVISSSVADTTPVFEKILDSCEKLFATEQLGIFLVQPDGQVHAGAWRGAAFEAVIKTLPRPVEQTATGIVIQNLGVLHIPSTALAEDLPRTVRDLKDQIGDSSMAWAPMLGEERGVGSICVMRQPSDPFSDKELTLLKTFSDQAVIAIQNTRLFNETKEALERQTATSEVLQVISGSISDAKPVFECILESTKRLIVCENAGIFLAIDEQLHCAAMRGPDAAVVNTMYPRPLSQTSAPIVIALGRQVCYPDVASGTDVPTSFREISATIERNFSVALTPLLWEGVAIGTLNVSREAGLTFNDKELGLLRSFANQAVIAIQNARLFDEVRARTEDLRESLQQQTATADVLKVISRSAFDLQTVLDTLTESAARLSNAHMAAIARKDDRGFYHATNYNFAVDWVGLTDKLRLQPGRGSVVGRALLAGKAVQITDVLADPEYEYADMQQAAAYRTLLGVPLMRGNQAIGALFLGRKIVERFSEKQVDLVSTFADQAVIAIENARLFEEVKAKTRDLEEALTYQTGSANILNVIASSPTNVQPVLKVIVESACDLCEAYDAVLILKNGEELQLSAHHGPIPINRRRWVNDRTSVSGRAIAERRPVHVHDVLSDEGLEFPMARDMSLADGCRTLLSVPLLREGEPIGTIILRRAKVHPFSDKQVALLRTFADQAVIAIQNAKLFNETKEALERQTATAEILKVIASSPSDVQPVFDVIVERALRLCEGRMGRVYRYDGSVIQMVAGHGLSAPGLGKVQQVFPRPATDDTIAGQVMLSHRPYFVTDIQHDDSVPPLSRQMIEALGTRSQVTVPMLRTGEAIGAITIGWAEPGAFGAQQVSLLQTFADQAVIAIENVRLFNETQEALERQTATADILKVIASSPSDVQPVFEAIATSANRLIGGFSTTVFRFVDGIAHLKAFTPTNPAADKVLQTSFPRPVADFEPFELAQSGRPIPIADIENMSHTEIRDIARARGFRSMLFAPLMSKGSPIGIIGVTRVETGSFADDHIQLLQTFADQAVIAIENARLFEEVQARTLELTEALEQQTATSEVLSVISSSAGDLAPVFEAMLGKAMQLCGASFGVLNTYDGRLFHTAATYGLPPAYDAFRRSQPLDYGPTTAPARLLQGEPYVEIDDLLNSEAYRNGDPNRRALVDIGGACSLLAVPLLKDERVFGNVMIFRQEKRPFSEKQIRLLQQFAAQAVIAIENTRLLRELRERTHDLTQSLEDLRAAQNRLVQTEKLASLGQLTAGIAHEIKNPLNFVNNFSAVSAELVDEMTEVFENSALDEAGRRKELDEIRDLLKSNLEKIVQHGKRADSIVKNMLLHSREATGERRSADINAIVEDSLNLAYHGARAERTGFNITLQRDLDPAAGEIELYPQELTRALLNLISNGFYAAIKRKETGADGFEPILSAATKSTGSNVEIRIRDNGTGIPIEVREKIFNPFFTTKPAGEGTGLGLSMSHDIVVKQHGGTIDVDTEPGAFTEFIITLPRKSARA